MNAGTTYNQRQIVLVPFPYSDLSGAKKRPALIISNKKMDESDDVICCLVTSHPTKHDLVIGEKAFEQGSLPFKSWVKPYEIFTVEKNTIIKTLATINNTFYRNVLDEIFSFLK